MNWGGVRGLNWIDEYAQMGWRYLSFTRPRKMENENRESYARRYEGLS